MPKGINRLVSEHDMYSNLFESAGSDLHHSLCWMVWTCVFHIFFNLFSHFDGEYIISKAGLFFKVLF